MTVNALDEQAITADRTLERMQEHAASVRCSLSCLASYTEAMDRRQRFAFDDAVIHLQRLDDALHHRTRSDCLD